MTKQLLSLDTLVERPVIAIDGTRYELLSPDELSVLDYQRFGLWQRRLAELQEDGEESPELDELVERIARKAAVGVPEAVFAKLTGAHKIAVVEVFTGLLLRSRWSVAGATMTAMGSESPATGASWFPDFPGFTAAPRATGWKARLWRWLGLTPR